MAHRTVTEAVLSAYASTPVPLQADARFDAGPAIPKAVQAGLFEAFHRETTAANNRSSIGLGLFIASEIVRAHGGSIAVRSPDRDGTTFTVVLPRRPVGIDLGPAESVPTQLH